MINQLSSFSPIAALEMTHCLLYISLAIAQMQAQIVFLYYYW